MRKKHSDAKIAFRTYVTFYKACKKGVGKAKWVFLISSLLRIRQKCHLNTHFIMTEVGRKRGTPSIVKWKGLQFPFPLTQEISARVNVNKVRLDIFKLQWNVAGENGSKQNWNLLSGIQELHIHPSSYDPNLTAQGTI